MFRSSTRTPSLWLRSGEVHPPNLGPVRLPDPYPDSISAVTVDAGLTSHDMAEPMSLDVVCKHLPVVAQFPFRVLAWIGQIAILGDPGKEQEGSATCVVVPLDLGQDVSWPSCVADVGKLVQSTALCRIDVHSESPKWIVDQGPDNDPCPEPRPEGEPEREVSAQPRLNDPNRLGLRDRGK